ncbi:MAG: hypothetical protein AAB732_00015 [Patescibacteria group bacterium]
MKKNLEYPLNNNPEQELMVRELCKKLKDLFYLPTHKDVTFIFKNPEKFFSNEYIRLCDPDKKHPVFEFLNEEFINAFSDYLFQQIKNLDEFKTNKPITILEVCAGNGRLTYFLQQKFEKILSEKVKIIGTDSKQWGLKTFFPVEKLDYKAAIKKYQPEIIICSWMPPEEDFTKDFRSFESVKEYILIGESDNNCCGNRWLTWGINYDKKDQIIPYVADGFERIDINEVKKYQICKTDMIGQYNHSNTVSFRRKNKKIVK